MSGFDVEVCVTIEILTIIPSEPPSPSSDTNICVHTEDANIELPNPPWSAGERGLASICFEPMAVDGLLNSAPATAVDSSTSTTATYLPGLFAQQKPKLIAANKLSCSSCNEGSTIISADHIDNEDLDILADLVLLTSDETLDTPLTCEDWMECEETSMSIADSPLDFDVVSTYLAGEQGMTSTSSSGAANHCDLAEGLLNDASGDHHFLIPLSELATPITCLATDQIKETTSSSWCAKDNEVELEWFAQQKPELPATYELPCSSCDENFMSKSDVEISVTNKIPSSVPSEPPSPSPDMEICVPTEDRTNVIPNPPSPSWLEGEQGLASIYFEPMTLDDLLDNAPPTAADLSTSATAAETKRC